MKLYLRIDIDDDDVTTQNMISTARERAEDLTARCLLRQQWVFSFDKFPTWWGNESGSSYFFEHHHPRHHSMFRSDNVAIILPRGPVLSVDSITYKDISGTVQTLDPATYNVDLLSQPARIRPLYNGVWPQALWDTNSVVIKFTAGYEQTVTEVLTVPSVAPFAVTISRFNKFLSLTSVTDVASGTLLSGCSIDINGAVTVPSGEAGLRVSVVYQVNSIPNSFLMAIKLLCAAWNENRAEVAQGGGNFNSLPTPIAATSLLGTYELFPVGYPKS
jgi:hypothetical protein